MAPRSQLETHPNLDCETLCSRYSHQGKLDDLISTMRALDSRIIYHLGLDIFILDPSHLGLYACRDVSLDNTGFRHAL